MTRNKIAMKDIKCMVYRTVEVIFLLSIMALVMLIVSSLKEPDPTVTEIYGYSIISVIATFIVSLFYLIHFSDHTKK